MSNGKDKKDKAANDREHFRITYRSPENPIFECDKNKFVVFDLSESGIRFAPKKGMQFFEQDQIVGQVVLPEKRGIIAIRGKIIRVTTLDIAVQLAANSLIPLAKIMEEQRILIQKGKL